MPTESFDHGREEILACWPMKSPAIWDFNSFQKQENLYINCGQLQEGFGVISADSPKDPVQDSYMQFLVRVKYVC